MRLPSGWSDVAVRDEGAEYWHMGATMRRFLRVRERMRRGWKMVGVKEGGDMAVPGGGP